jgi:pheromone shutdown protein TraB
MPVLTAILVVGAFAAFFVSFLFAPFAVLAVLYGAMIFAGRARAKKRRLNPAPPVTPQDKKTTA